MKITNYTVFGENDKYVEITFKDDDSTITVASTDGKPFVIDKAEDASIEFMENVIGIINSGKLEIGLER